MTTNAEVYARGQFRHVESRSVLKPNVLIVLRTYQRLCQNRAKGVSLDDRSRVDSKKSVRQVILIPKLLRPRLCGDWSQVSSCFLIYMLQLKLLTKNLDEPVFVIDF